LLFSLWRSGAVGVNEKLEKLKSKESYHETYYEIFVAGQFLSDCHRVRFIETSTKKSPDLLIDDGVQIECKSKDVVHPYYRKYQDLWYTVIMSKCPEWMERMRVNYLISVKFDQEVDNDSIGQIKNKIHDIIYSTKVGTFRIENGRATIKAKPLLPYDQILDEPLTDETFPDIMNDIPVDFDFMQHINTIQPTKEKVYQKNFKFIAMKIPHHPKRRIISNLKKASNQFNRSLPSVIYRYQLYNQRDENSGSR